jgi:hypothetical protein
MHTAIIEYAQAKEARTAALELRKQASKTLAKALEVEAQASFISRIKERLPANAFTYLSTFGSPELRITLPVKGFLCDVAPELADIIEFISDYYEKPPFSTDLPNQAARCYTFTPEHKDTLGVFISAELVEGSDACQRVIVGTKKVEKIAYVEIDEPVYAFKC